MQAVLDEIIAMAVKLKPEERQKLMRVLEAHEGKAEPEKKKGFVHPNTIWIKEHRAEYQGKYVAVEDGKLVGTGKNYPEALAESKKNGSLKPMITYLFPLDSEPFGGW